MKKSELRLVAHDPAWAGDFRAERNRLAAAFGADVLRIEHVGSTAIPTVHAKPILDLAVLCGPRGIAPVAAALPALGYEFRGRFDERDEAHYYAVRDRGDVRLCQAHIFAAASADYRLKLLFRDVLARDAALAHEYDEYKLALAATAAGKTDYAEKKTRWVDRFIEKVQRAAADEAR